MLQEDGITELPPIFETWKEKHLSHGTILVFSIRDENGVIQALCLVCVLMMFYCSDSTFGKQVFDCINNTYAW